MKIGLDLDNVIIDIMSSARAAVAADHDLSIDEVIETNVYWDPFTHKDPSLGAKFKPDHTFWDREDVLLKAPVLPGALKAVRKIHRLSLLACYITRRPPHVAHLTRQWLEEGGFPMQPIVHVGHADRTQNFLLCKSEGCRAHGVTHMIDDQPHEIETLMKAGIQTVLVDAPPGRAKRHAFMETHPHIPVARTIADATELLLKEHARAA